MSEQCIRCEEAHEEIGKLETRVKALENFKKWAEPILKRLKWMIYTSASFVSLIIYVYVFQIYPFFGKNQDNFIIIIDRVSDIKQSMLKWKIETLEDRALFKKEILKTISNTEKKIISHNTELSKDNTEDIRSSLHYQNRKMKEGFEKPSNFSMTQNVGAE